MSYLLGYQKWRKLHESAKYGKLYEQAAFVKGSAISSIVLAGTSTTPVMESTLVTNCGLAAGKGKTSSLYEISLKDALAQNFGAATFVRALGANEPKDQFILLDSSNKEIDKKVGLKQTITFTVNQENLNNLKIQFAGNGVLTMHRAAIKTKTIPQDNLYHVRLYMGYGGKPVPALDLAGEDTARFSVLVGINVEGLMDEAKLTAQIILGACGYIAAEKETKDKIVSNLDRVLGSTDFSTKVYPGGDFSALKKYPTGILEPSGLIKYIKQDELAVPGLKNVEAMKDLVPYKTFYRINEFGTGAVVDNQNDKKADPMFQNAMAAINEYATSTVAKITSAGGLIDSYFEQQLKGIEEDVLSDLRENARTKTLEAVKALKAKYPPDITFQGKVTKSPSFISLSKIARIITTYVISTTTKAKERDPSGRATGEVETNTFREGKSGN